MRQNANHHSGQKRQQNRDDEPQCRRVAVGGGEHLPQLGEIDRQDRQYRAELDQNGKGLAKIIVAASNKLNCPFRPAVSEAGMLSTVTNENKLE
mgnify:CR=1 FL=1